MSERVILTESHCYGLSESVTFNFGTAILFEKMWHKWETFELKKSLSQDFDLSDLVLAGTGFPGISIL